MTAPTDSHRPPLDDAMVYRRTVAGQRTLISSSLLKESTQERVLARVNGYSDVRQLLELSPEPSSAVGAALLALLDLGLIELVVHKDTAVESRSVSHWV